MAEALRILLVEDSEDDAVLIERALSKGGLEVEVTRVEDAGGFEAALESGADIILADYHLPTFGANGALERLEASGEDIPFVVVTGTIGEERAAQILRAGAHDFLLKGNLARLAPVVDREVREARMRRDRREARTELQAAQERYEALIESASDVIYVVDREARVLFASPSATELTGLSPEALQGAHALSWVHDEDRDEVRRRLDEVASGGGRARVEYRVVRPDGTVVPVESVLNNLVHEEAVGGVVVNTRDLSERRALEAQLIQAQKMEAVGRLAGGIAHDFNNLLMVITGNTRMLLEALEGETPEHQDARQILKAAERASALTRQLLAFSRNQAMSPRVVDAGKVVSGLEPMLRRVMSEAIALEIEAAGEAWIRVDPVQLEQVLMNLAVNAREAMPGGGEVTVSVEAVPWGETVGSPEGAVEIDGDERRVMDVPHVRISFRDSGPGIPPEARKRVFEPFFTTKEMGSGLGLSTVYGIVRQSGGRVRVGEAPGGGAEIVTLFPLTGPPAAAESEVATGGETDEDQLTLGGLGEKLLLVEDSAGVRRVAQRILVRSGFQVIEAVSGPEALELLDDDPSGVRLLVTDVLMPEMSGPELVRQAREMRPDLPIVYMSGYSGEEVLDMGSLDDRTAFLEKPFSPEELNLAVRRLLDRTGS